MTDIQPRYEFRVWGTACVDAIALLRGMAAPAGAPVSTVETYLVTMAREDANAKIRADLMDLKVLQTVAQGCEQWYPLLKAEFPVAASLLQDLLPRLGLTSTAIGRDTYELQEFIEEVVNPSALLKAVRVEKTRDRFVLECCIADVAEVTKS